MPSDKPGRRKAAALGYNPEKDEAPKVLAAGQGHLAEMILSLAKSREVPIWHDHPLAEALIKVEIGREIPPALYQAVAQVLAFLWQMEQRAGRAVAARRDEGEPR